MERDLLKRKITLFLCRKWECWIKPDSCIERQKTENFTTQNNKQIPDTVFDLSYCKECEQGRAMKELQKTYFKFSTIKGGKNE